MFSIEKKLTHSLFDHFAFLVVTVLINLGSLGVFTAIFLYLGIVLACLLVGFKLVIQKNIYLPRHYVIYLVFIGILAIHTSKFSGDFYYFWIYASGAVFWLLAANFKNVLEEHFYYLIYTLGLLMATLFITTSINPISTPNLATLFAPATSAVKHSNIGDLWSIIIVASVIYFHKRNKVIGLIFIAVGLLFIATSFSRSAVVASVIGVGFVILKTRWVLFKKIFPLFLAVFAVIFITISLSKSVLFSRPYFAEALSALFNRPLGTGLGNFSLISTSSNFAHSIFLEVVSALGVFSIPFIVWLGFMVKDILVASGEDIGYSAVELTILAIFMFTPNYIIFGLVWLWFLTIGLKRED